MDKAIVDFPPLIEKQPHQRWAAYFHIKGKQRRNRVLQETGAQMSFSIHMGCIISANVVRRFILYSLFPYFHTLRFLYFMRSLWVRPPHLRLRISSNFVRRYELMAAINSNLFFSIISSCWWYDAMLDERF